MSFKIKDLEKEDIDCNFSEEDRQKLLDYYIKNEISLESLPKHLKTREIPHKTPGKTPRNSVLKDLEGPKIKKKLKKAINPEISLPKFQNLDTIVKKSPAIPEKNVMNVHKSAIRATEMHQMEKIEKNSAIIKEIALNHPINNINNGLQNMVRVEENKEEEETKEKLRNLFAVMRENNPQIFFYILYKNFKDEMSRQISKKSLQISNIKM